MRMTIGLAILFLALAACDPPPVAGTALPKPRTKGPMSLEEALAQRRSLREFASKPLERAQIGQLCWAAQGETNARGFRTAPSAGALFPLEIYVATAQGLAHYVPRGHRFEIKGNTDLRSALRQAALGQEAIGTAPAVFVVTGVEARTAGKYGGRAKRYVQMEAGHAAENLLLQATALGLGGVTIGAFHDDRIARVLGLVAGEVPLYLLPIGHPR